MYQRKTEQNQLHLKRLHQSHEQDNACIHPEKGNRNNRRMLMWSMEVLEVILYACTNSQTEDNFLQESDTIPRPSEGENPDL